MSKKISEIILPNGLRVVQADDPRTMALTVLVLFGTGSRYEPERLEGISHYLEHMYFKGTKRRPSALKVALELDSMGSNYNAFTGKEYTGYYIKAAAEHFEHMLDILSDMLFNPLFDPKEMEKEKGAVIQEINMYEDSPREFVDDLYELNLFGENHPLGRLIAGTKERVRGISRRDLVGYLKTHYFAQNSLVVVSGGLGRYKNAVKLLEKYFGRMPRGRPQIPQKFVRPKSYVPLVHYRPTEQTHMIVGALSYPYTHKKKLPAKILATILGGGMSSRLFIKIRERRGLAYYVRTGTGEYLDTGTLATQTGVENSKAESAVSAIVKEYRAVAGNLKESELKKAKEIITGRMILDEEDSMNVAMRLGMDRLYKMPLKTLDERISEVNAVRLDAVRAVAKEVFGGQLSLSLIGPFKDANKFAKLLK